MCHFVETLATTLFSKKRKKKNKRLWSLLFPSEPVTFPVSSLFHANASCGPCASGIRPPRAWHFDGQLCSSGPTPAVRITHATNLPWCPAAKPGPAAPLLFINMHEHANEAKKAHRWASSKNPTQQRSLISIISNPHERGPKYHNEGASANLRSAQTLAVC